MPTSRREHYEKLADQHAASAQHGDAAFREAHQVIAEGYRLMAEAEARFYAEPPLSVPLGLALALHRPVPPGLVLVLHRPPPSDDHGSHSTIRPALSHAGEGDSRCR